MLMRYGPPHGPPPGLPPGPPPNGAPPMSIDFSSRAPQILVGVLIPFTFASFFVMGRLYTRAVIVRSWGMDDTAIMLSWILGLGVTVNATVSTRYGSGFHQDTIPPTSATPALQLDYANLLFYNAALAATKLSVCLFYLRIFADRTSRFLIFGTIICIFCYFTPCEMINAFQCSPMEGIWNKGIPSKCIDWLPCFYTMAACNLLGDAWLIAISVPRILPLRIARRQKIALMCVITSGWLVILASIVRVIRMTRSQNSTDRSWNYYDTAIWSGLEVSVSLFCVSAPAIKPLVQKHLPCLLASFAPPTERYEFTENRYTTNHYIKSVGGTGNLTSISHVETAHELQDMNKRTVPYSNGKAGDQVLSRSNSKVGNRIFWRERRDGDEDSDSESMVDFAACPQLPAGVDETPATGIMKSTSVTVSVEDFGRGPGSGVEEGQRNVADYTSSGVKASLYKTQSQPL